MKEIIFALKKTLFLLRNDRIVLFLTVIPIVLGFLLYTVLLAWIYGNLLPDLKLWATNFIDMNSYGKFLYYIFSGIITIILFFIINWTFALIVSLFAAPFNDMLSTRVSKTIKDLPLDEFQNSLKKMIASSFLVIINESKKILFIFFVSICALLLNFFPLLMPLSLFISSLLLSSSFLDYSWARNSLSFKECLKDIKKRPILYGFSGGIFTILMSIPFLNILSLPFGVIYFTILYEKKSQVLGK